MASSNDTSLIQTNDNPPYHILYSIKNVVEVTMIISMDWYIPASNEGTMVCLANTHNIVVISVLYHIVVK